MLSNLHDSFFQKYFLSFMLTVYKTFYEKYVRTRNANREILKLEIPEFSGLKNPESIYINHYTKE